MDKQTETPEAKSMTAQANPEFQNTSSNNNMPKPTKEQADEEKRKLKALGDMKKKGLLFPPMPDTKYVSGKRQIYGSQWHEIQILAYAEHIEYTQTEYQRQIDIAAANGETLDDNVAVLRIMADRIKSLDRKLYYAVGIIHDQDGHVSVDHYYTAREDKPHAHLVIWIPPELGHRKRYYTRDIINALGITYRFPEGRYSDPNVPDDEWFILTEAIAAVRDITDAIMYLTHETQKAIFEGKTFYPPERRFSNLETAEIEEITKGYSLYHAHNKPTAEDWDNLAVMAANAARESFLKCPSMPLEEALDNWKTAFTGHFIQFRDKPKWAKLEAEFKSAWNIEKRKWEHERRRRTGNELDRCCIFIRGDKNEGKSESSFRALLALLGRQFPDAETDLLESLIEDVTQSKNGNLDNVDIYTEAIILNDCWVDDLLGLAEQKPVRLYRRNKNNPMFCGRYLIITSNFGFHEYLDKHWTLSLQDESAIKSRFFRYHMDDGKLVRDADGCADRGKQEKQARLVKMADDFAAEFQKTHDAYWQEKRKKDSKDKINVFCRKLDKAEVLKNVRFDIDTTGYIFFELSFPDKHINFREDDLLVLPIKDGDKDYNEMLRAFGLGFFDGCNILLITTKTMLRKTKMFPGENDDKEEAI